MTQKGKVGISLFNAIIGIILMVIIGYALAKFLTPKPQNIVLTDDEKLKLNYLMQAIVYDGYNYYPKTNLRYVEFDDMSNVGKITIAAKYLYLLNKGRINPNDSEITLDQETMDLITKQVKKTFDNTFLKYTNFSIILDEYGCGTQVFSSDFGIEGSETCLFKAGALEIKDMYYKDNYYVVEAYIAFGMEAIKSQGTLQCKATEDKVMSYFSVYDKVTMYRPVAVKEYNRCCEINFGCTLEGAAAKRDYMIEVAKKQNLLYKILFKKKGETFIPYRID